MMVQDASVNRSTQNFKAIGVKPKRTLRAVMYMNEEISQTGGKNILN